MNTDIRIENDFSGKYPSDITGCFIPSTNIEVIRQFERGRFAYALFDFDGTISLIREGWQSVMSGLMLEVLSDTPAGKDEPKLDIYIHRLIAETTGKQTIYQMIALSEEVKKRGGEPLEPADYKAEYLRRLLEKISERRESLRCGAARPEDYLVPGAKDFLLRLKHRGLSLYLASGTDQEYVEEESALLAVSTIFEGNIFGARDDYKSFSKALVIQQILTGSGIDGRRLLGFGDGFVEIDNTKSAGGIAIGAATNEKDPAFPDEGKRRRLLAVGADIIIPNFSCHSTLCGYLMGECNEAV
ncbi:MAG: HAD family hydrolase [Abditibacteriota bacterium]|nr:HAD family hydrolase [Abditibacteriota bacterium]